THLLSFPSLLTPPPPRSPLFPYTTLFRSPASSELIPDLLRVGKCTLDRLAHLLRLLPHRSELDLELAHPTLCLVELHRRRVDLHPQARRRLVDEVDRLVGQEAVGDVAVRQHRGGDERSVADAYAVMRLV